MNELRSAEIQKPGNVRVRGCSRCGGTGAFGPHVVYAGRCFKCGGTGSQPGGVAVFAYPESWTQEQVDEHVAAKAAKKNAAADRKAAKKALERAAVLAANVERFPSLALVDQLDSTIWHVVRDIASKASDVALSEKQGALIERWGAEQAQKALDASVEAAADEVEPEAVECPEGKLELTGEVLKVKWQDSGFGGQLKMLVECGGFKVWGTVPAAIAPERGDFVRFNCSVERSTDDPSFGFFKRPTKAQILVTEEVC